MPGGDFKFKQFEIKQDRCVAKVGTDGCLLAAWTELPTKGNVLDVGTGTGVIALMTAQRNQKLTITGIDIDAESVQQASQNAFASPWKDRLKFIECKLDSFVPEENYELIISNPPFFQNSHKSGNEAKNRIRHQDSLSGKALIEFAKEHLGPEGKLAVIYPVFEGERFKEMALKAGFYLKRSCQVSPKVGKPFHRVMLELTLNIPLTASIFEILFIENKSSNTRWSNDFTTLLRDFYLKF